MRALLRLGWFEACRALGRLLRAARYASVEVVRGDRALRVRKRRARYAPLLVRAGEPMMRLLDTGVRVLPQRAWVERERTMYRHLHSSAIGIGADGALVLPCLAGRTLATLLEDPATDATARGTAVSLAVAALAELHRRGFTHADAMAENVLVDVDAGVARWFDFETAHDERRAMEWRRADDVRALLATVLLRTDRASRGAVLRLVTDAYADDAVTRRLAAGFAAPPPRALAFHLGQAPLSLADYAEAARALQAITGG